MSQARHYENQEIMAELVTALSEIKESAASAPAAATGGTKRSALESAAIFDEIAAGITDPANAASAKSVKAILLYVLLKDGKEATKYSKINIFYNN